MAKESFPRVRDDTFGFIDYGTMPFYTQGRLDLYSGKVYSTPAMAKALGAANGMRNIMALRPAIRKLDDSIRNELVLKGYTGTALETAYSTAMLRVITGKNTWMAYSNLADGVVTDAEGGRVIMHPDYQTLASWHSRYDKLKDVSDG